jgi:hypothetical protein
MNTLTEKELTDKPVNMDNYFYNRALTDCECILIDLIAKSEPLQIDKVKLLADFSNEVKKLTR